MPEYGINMVRTEVRDALYNELEERIETLEWVYEELAHDELVETLSRVIIFKNPLMNFKGRVYQYDIHIFFFFNSWVSKRLIRHTPFFIDF